MENIKSESNLQSPTNEDVEPQMLWPDIWGKTRGPGSGPSYSPVWNYFVLDDDNPILATCLICGIRMSRGGVTPNRCGTTNLRRHLSYAHGLALPSNRRNAWAGQTGSSTSVTSPAQLQPSSSSPSPVTNTSSPQFVQSVHMPLIVPQRTHLRPILPKKQPNQYYQPSNQSKTKVRLRWNSYHSNMQAAFPSLLYSEQFVDVTLACEGKSIKCHKVMLSACSSYFEDLLIHNPCKHPIILMKDLRFWEVQALVDFMYNGEVNVQEDKLPSLLAAAEALQIKGLTGPVNNSSADGEAEEDESIPSENCTPVIDEKPVIKTRLVPKKTRKRKVALLTQQSSNQKSLYLGDHKTQTEIGEKASSGNPVVMETIVKEEPVDVLEESVCEVIEQEDYIIEGSSTNNDSDNHISNKGKPETNEESSSEHSSGDQMKNHRSQRENSETIEIKKDSSNSVSLKAKSLVKNESESVFPRIRLILSDGSLTNYDDNRDENGVDGDKSKNGAVKRIKTESVSDESVDD